MLGHGQNGPAMINAVWSILLRAPERLTQLLANQEVFELEGLLKKRGAMHLSCFKRRSSGYCLAAKQSLQGNYGKVPGSLIIHCLISAIDIYLYIYVVDEDV